MIRLYGHLRGSFRTVSEGLKLAFREHGVLEGVYIGEAQDFDAPPVGGATAPIAVVVGDPLRSLMAHTQGDHREVWLLLAPNSEGVPPKIVNELKAKRRGRPTVDGLLAPSKWAKYILEQMFPELPVELCAHGVLPCFQMDRDRRMQAAAREGFLVLHLTSTNLSRKCTKELVNSWKRAALKGAQLFLGVNPEYANELRSFIGQDEGIRVINGQNLEFAALARLFNQVDFVAQPSRAEGFGLVPLEARACGVPIILTECTGHADHVEHGDGIILVPTWDSEESDDYWGAKAPVVREVDIHSALIQAYQQRKQHTEAAIANADAVREQWTWTNGAAGVVAKWKEKYV